MLSELFSSIYGISTATQFSVGGFFLCTAVSLILGLGIAAAHGFRNRGSKSFAVTLALLPCIVQMVIMLVNGNLGTGVAVMGAFSLVRFRSVPGTAKEITNIFLAMAVGLATGMGYLMVAVLFVVIVGGIGMLFAILPFGEVSKGERRLQITIPESLNYSDVFTDLFEQYTASCRLQQVKTTNMGSLYKLTYQIVLKEESKEKEFIDDLRCRNGNLEISCGLVPAAGEGLI